MTLEYERRRIDVIVPSWWERVLCFVGIHRHVSLGLEHVFGCARCGHIKVEW